MPTLDRLKTALTFPFRTRLRALLSAVVLAGLVALTWYGSKVYAFHRDLAGAEQALAEYDFTAARQRLDECIRFRPRDPAALLLAAQAARRDGATADAEALLERYWRAAGPTDEWRLESALTRASQGRVEEDVDFLLPLIDSRHPAGEIIMEALASGSVQRYRYDLAGFWGAQLLKHFPRNPIGRLLRAEYAMVRGKHSQAAAECRSILEDFPRFYRVRIYRAGVLYTSQNYAEGAEAYRELRRERPGDLEVTLGLARCLNRLGRTEEVRPLIRELEEQHGASSEALLECGRFSIKDHRPADAERFLREALRLAPKDHEVHLQLGICLEELGRTEESRLHIAEFKRIEADLLRMETLLGEISKDPKAPGPRREMGLICLRNGQHQEALRWLYGVLDTTPNDFLTQAALAEYYQSQGNTEQAEYHRRRVR